MSKISYEEFEKQIIQHVADVTGEPKEIPTQYHLSKTGILIGKFLHHVAKAYIYYCRMLGIETSSDGAAEAFVEWVRKWVTDDK
ncbi:MAG: hypothetical protein GY849_17730 [Deltaproteobacteria bacterium]|nr:hypothetical protein [Deltaproteobacteria bacterium]